MKSTADYSMDFVVMQWTSSTIKSWTCHASTISNVDYLPVEFHHRRTFCRSATGQPHFLLLFLQHVTLCKCCH